MSFFRKISLVLALLFACITVLAACTPTGGNDDDNQTADTIAAGDDIRFLKGVGVDYDNMFFDGFTQGVSYDDWFIGKQAWGANANGGVIPQNVNYTDEGVLVFNGNGGYYTSGEVSGVGAVKDGSLTGGAIISKFVTGPGRYEVKMKVLPRLGACSAFWTYCYETETAGNHEIDIELPGGKDHSANISFENLLNTNYITVEMNQSQDVDVAEATGSQTPIALNDGEWHTFGFDWYTNPQMVVYYVDGKVTAVSKVFVPYVQARMWLGVWFPNNSGFVGDANFESDVMCVDYVKHVPFLDQPCQTYNPAISNSQVASADEYPSKPIAVTAVNKVANGSFEYVETHDYAGYGWNIGRRILTGAEKTAIRNEIKEQIKQNNPTISDADLNAQTAEAYKQREKEILSVAEEDVCSIATGIGNNGSCGATVTDIGRVQQVIDAVYEGFKLDLSFVGKGVGSVTVRFATTSGQKIEEHIIEINNADWKTFSQQLTAPQNTGRVILLIDSVLDNQLFADEFVLYVNK